MRFRNNTVRVYLEGGTGNQLFMYFAGLSTAINTNSSLFLDTKLIGAFGTNHGSFLDQLNIHAKISTYSNTSNLSLKKTRIINSLARRISFIRYIRYKLFRFYQSNEIGFDDEIFEFRKSMKISGYFQSWKYYHFCTLRGLGNLELLSPSKEYIYLKSLIQQEPTLAVHVRRGDYSEVSNILGMLDEDWYVRGVNNVFSNFGILRIWVFSDDIATVKKSFKNSVWEEAIFTNFNLNPIETILLMSLASAHVISNSTFSYWSALLSQNQGKVIAPSPWFKGLENPRDLIPSNWLTEKSTWLS